MIKIFKKLILLSLTLGLFLSLSSVGAQAASKSTANWTLYKTQASRLTSSQNKIFQKGIKSSASSGKTYKPVAMLSRQKSSGLYAFLALRSSTSGNSSLEVLIISAKSGSYTILAENTVNVKSVSTLASPKKVTGWTDNTSSFKKKNPTPAAARKAFKKAAKAYGKTAKLSAVAFLAKRSKGGSQYYRALAIGKKNGSHAYYIVDVHKSRKGVCRVTSCRVLNMSSYLKTPSAVSASKTTTTKKLAQSAAAAAVEESPLPLTAATLSSKTDTSSLTEKIVPLSDDTITLAFSSASSSDSALRQKIVNAALSYVGKTPYVAAGNSLKTGTDCSGFVYWIYKEYAGITTERSSSEFKNMMNISYKDLLPGDVVVYNHHVALYIGNDQIVHAKGSQYGTVNDTMWYNTPLGYCRIL